MHLSAGGDFEQQALSQMLDFHEGLGGWLAGCQAGWLACGDADLRVNKTHGHLDLHVFQMPQPCRKGGGEVHLSAGSDFEQRALSQMLDFHEVLGGWLAGCQAGWLAGWLIAGTPIYV